MSPGAPPAAAIITSPLLAVSFIKPINCPWVITAFVTGESGSVFLSKTTSGSIASANCFAQIFTPALIGF